MAKKAPRSLLVGADFFYRLTDPRDDRSHVVATRVWDAAGFRAKLVERTALEDAREVAQGERLATELRVVEVITAAEYSEARSPSKSTKPRSRKS